MHFSVLMFETYTISILTTANSFAFYTFITKCRCLGAKSTLLWNCNTTPIRQPQKCGRSRTEIPSTNLGAYSMLVELVLERAFLVELLSYCQCASSDSVAHTLWPIELGVARSAIDAAIGSVVQIGRVQVFPALHAVETELVPHVLRALHLFRGEDHESASRTPVLRLLSVAIDGSPAAGRVLVVGGHQGGRVSVPDAFGAKELRVAELAIDIVIRSVTGEHRVQGSGAPGAVEALPVVHLPLGQLQLGRKDRSATSGTSLAVRSHDRSGVRSHKGSFGCQVLLSNAVGLQETGSTGESVAMGSPLLAIASLAVDLIVRTIARDNGVQSFGAVPTLEALPVPAPSLGEYLFRGEYYAATTWTSFSDWRLDLLHIYDGGFGSHVALPLAIPDVGHQPQGRNADVPVTPGPKLLSITSSTVNVLVRTITVKS